MLRKVNYSSRLPWQLRPNPLSELLSRKTHVLDLTESNPTHSGFRYPEQEILSGFQALGILSYDPFSAGLPAARQTVADLAGVDVGRVLLTTSTSEGYSWLFKLLTDPGDEILVPRPSYPLFEYLAALESVHILPYPLAYHGGWSVDFHALSEAVTPRTRAIVVVNPNNPTGSYLKRGELEQLVELCLARSLAIISDEVFSDYLLARDDRCVRTLAGLQEPAVFCLNGLSKLIGMPQMKLGWIIANRRDALDRLELIADTYLSVGTPVQYALPNLLAAKDVVQPQIIERLRANLAFLQSRLTGAVSMRKVEGGWNAILQVPRTRTEEEWALELLASDDVLTQPGYFYNFEAEAFLVVSLLTRPAIFEEGITRLLRRVA